MKMRKKIKIRKWMVADEGEPVSVYDFKGDAIASAEALNDAYDCHHHYIRNPAHSNA